MNPSIDIEALVAAVTAEVMARLDPARQAPAARRYAFLLPLPGRALPAAVAAASALSRRGHDVSLLASPQAEAALRQLGLEKAPVAVAPLEATAGEWLSRGLQGREALVLGSLGFSLLARLVRREDDDPCVRLLLGALLRGCPVLALSDDLDGEGALAREAADRLRSLAPLGLTAISSTELDAALQRLERVPDTAARALGGLLTESDVERLGAAGERRLRLARRTAVTPLARSRAAELGLLLEREED
jgi:hypothetical protein